MMGNAVEISRPDPSAAAQSRADACARDDALARGKGASPEQAAARKRVAALFCQCHLPAETSDAVQAILQAIDCAQPVTTTNGRMVNLENPKGRGFLGMGNKPR